MQYKSFQNILYFFNFSSQTLKKQLKTPQKYSKKQHIFKQILKKLFPKKKIVIRVF